MPIDKLVDESRWRELNPEEQKILKKMVCSPLMIDQNCIGIACVHGISFSESSLKLQEISLWARMASLAIEKSMLYHRLQKRVETIEDELKRKQSLVIRSEKLRSLGEIAMSVAHIIRNPVMVIGGLGRRLHDRLPKDDTNYLWTEMIISEAERLESLVNEFERLFSMKQISFQRTDLNQIVKDAIDDFFAKEQIKSDSILKSNLSDEQLICRVDPALFERCIVHLLENAVEASNNSVHITINTCRAGKDAIVDVTDSGKGMSREEMDHVFDPFYTTKGFSAGMGLTFVHFVITEHSGQVELRSRKGVGTRFRIRVPLE
jgi:signal transduction histidine kinase